MLTSLTLERWAATLATSVSWEAEPCSAARVSTTTDVTTPP